MARRSSGRSSRPTPRPAPARNPPPQKANHAPPPAHAQSNSGGSIVGAIGSTIAEGLAFGTGTAVAHRAVDAVMGPRTIQLEKVVPEVAAASVPTAISMGGSEACGMQSKAFQDWWNSVVLRCLIAARHKKCLRKCSYRMGSKQQKQCALFSKMMMHQCLNSSGSDISKCQFYIDMLADCRRNSGSVLSS